MASRTAEARWRDALAACDRANDELIEGRSEPIKACFSHRQDASLFGGFGGYEVGWEQIGPRLDWVGQSFAGGTCAYDVLSASVGGELAYVVQFERGEARINGRAAPLRFAFRVTMVLRWEEDTWKLLHRHADHLIEKEKPS